MHDPARDARKVLRKIGASLVNTAPVAGDVDAFADAIEPERLDELLGAVEAPVRVRTLSDLVVTIAAEIGPKVGKITGGDTGNELHMLLLGLFVENELADSETLTIEKSLRRWCRSNERALKEIGFEEAQLQQFAVALSSRNIREAIHIVSSNGFRSNVEEFLREMDLGITKRYPEIRPEHVKKFHSSDRPLQFWTDIDRDGPLLFVVYYSGACTYKICFGCALPSLSSETPIESHRLIAQTDHVFDDLLFGKEKDGFSSVFLSNNGSLFDKPTFSATALHHAISRCLGEMPKLKRIVLETRAEFIDGAKLSAINELLSEYGSDVRIEIALGVEIFDEKLRNKVTKKGLTNRGLQRCIDLLGQYDMDLRCYFMLKPHPSMSDQDAYDDITGALDLLDEMSEKSGTRIVMHLNPTYAAIGTELETALADGSYTPPRLEELATFVEENDHRRTRIHIGLNDEGLAAKGGSFLRVESAAALEELKRHNMVAQ